jgi:hypothetical protein
MERASPNAACQLDGLPSSVAGLTLDDCSVKQPPFRLERSTRAGIEAIVS